VTCVDRHIEVTDVLDLVVRQGSCASRFRSPDSAVRSLREGMVASGGISDLSIRMAMPAPSLPMAVRRQASETLALPGCDNERTNTGYPDRLGLSITEDVEIPFRDSGAINRKVHASGAVLKLLLDGELDVEHRLV